MQRKTASLTPEIVRIVRDKETEQPHTSVLNPQSLAGSFLCRQCGTALFRTESAFEAGCGWPSFDTELPNRVRQQPDADSHRTEILCATCDAHLGHIFAGEQFTPANLRYCVNGLSLDFVANPTVETTEEIILAAGCFWGVEYYLKQLKGVVKTEVGYTGGRIEYPNYEIVCHQATGHVEALRVVYNPDMISCRQVLQYFFEIHDPTQTDGQGPDLGEQYLSKIFYYDEAQKNIATHLLQQLRQQGLNIATRLEPVSTFWKAEEYHQDYYTQRQQQPYCHRWVKREWGKP